MLAVLQYGGASGDKLATARNASIPIYSGWLLNQPFALSERT
jgi:hypothetical protein